MKFRVVFAFTKEAKDRKELNKTLGDLGEFLADHLNIRMMGMKVEEDKK